MFYTIHTIERTHRTIYEAHLVVNTVRSECVVNQRWLECRTPKVAEPVKPMKSRLWFAKRDNESRNSQRKPEEYSSVVNGTSANVNGTDWTLRLTLDQQKSQLAFSLVGDDSIALFQLRIANVLDYTGFVLPFLTTCHPGSVHYTMSLRVRQHEKLELVFIWVLKDISYRKNRFLHIADSPENATVWAEAEILRVFPRSSNFEGLKGLLLSDTLYAHILSSNGCDQ